MLSIGVAGEVRALWVLSKAGRVQLYREKSVVWKFFKFCIPNYTLLLTIEKNRGKIFWTVL